MIDSCSKVRPTTSCCGGQIITNTAGSYTGAVSEDGDAERRYGDVAGRQCRVGEVATLLVVISHVERAQLGEVDTQRAAAIVDVRTVQRLNAPTTNHRRVYTF